MGVVIFPYMGAGPLVSVSKTLEGAKNYITNTIAAYAEDHKYKFEPKKMVWRKQPVSPEERRLVKQTFSGNIIFNHQVAMNMSVLTGIGSLDRNDLEYYVAEYVVT